MRAWVTAKLRGGPRRPLAGAALAAVVGIVLAENWRTHGIHTLADAFQAQRLALGAFVLLVAAWGWRRRAAWCWAAVAAGYATLHLFASAPVPAMTLARVLAAPPPVLGPVSGALVSRSHVLRGVGIVTDVPRLVPPPPDLPGRPASTTWRFTLRLTDATVDNLRWPCHAAVSATWRDAPAALASGDRLEITALAENVAPPRNPGEFDRAARLRREGIFSEIRLTGIADGRRLPPAPGLARWFSSAPLHRLAGWVHGWMERTLRRDLADAPEVSAVVTTALLGLSNPPGLGDLEPAFQRTGTLHYFAVDGLKLGLVAYLLLQALKFSGLPRPWPGVLVLPLLLGYAFATGLSAASLRAVSVAVVLVVGELADRPISPLNSLGAAAAGVLLLNPPSLFDLGFQLTFSVMLAILLLVGPLNRRLQRLGAPDPFLPPLLFSRTFRAWESLRRRTGELVAVSAASWVGSLPVMLLVFHLFSAVSLAANVLTFPLAFAVLALGVLSLTAAAFSSLVSVWFNNANWLAAKGFLGLVRAFDAVPGGSFAVPSPANWHWPAPAAELVVYDFERGRAISLHAGRAEWLFDTARPGEFSGGILPALRARAVSGLNGGLLLTQNDADHLAAARAAVTELHPARIVESSLPAFSPLLRDFHTFLRHQGRDETFLHRGDLLPLGNGAQAAVLYPPGDLSGKFRTAADRALALRIDAAGWRILLLDEGNGAAAHWLLAHENSAALAGAILVTSAPVAPELLAAVHPRLLVLRPTVVKEATDRPVSPPPVAPAALPVSLPTLDQRESGAVTLLLYPDHLQATGYVDGRSVTLPAAVP